MPINTVTVWLPRKFRKNKKMNIENWIPIIYEPKTNTKKKKKKRKESQMKQLRLNRTKYSQMALLHIPNSKKEDSEEKKTMNSSTFSATKWILDLKKENASAKRRRVKNKKKKKKSQTVLWFPRFCLTPSCHLVSQPSTITFMSSSSFFLSIIQLFPTLIPSWISLKVWKMLHSMPLEMDFGELSFNAFVKDINEIGLCLVAEKVRETKIRKLESNFVWGLVFYFIFYMRRVRLNLVILFLG